MDYIFYQFSSIILELRNFWNYFEVSIINLEFFEVKILINVKKYVMKVLSKKVLFVGKIVNIFEL